MSANSDELQILVYDTFATLNTSGTDMVYTATVTAYDGRNKASCHLSVTVYDPSGAKGFPVTRTTCVASSGKPTPGNGGCPIGARALKTASFNEALSSSNLGSRKRVRRPSSNAWVISCTMMSCERQVKTRPWGRFHPWTFSSASKYPNLSSPTDES
jgi:hypothetical protein